MSLRVFAKNYHKATYAAISPTRPELSQKGRTVMVTGASTGIGFAIARGFVEAGASAVIILGRRQEALNEAGGQLEKISQNGTKVLVRTCDAYDLNSLRKLWADLQAEGIVVDTLVLSAAAYGKIEKILDSETEQVWADFEANVRSPLAFTQLFYKQKATRQKVSLER